MKTLNEQFSLLLLCLLVLASCKKDKPLKVVEDKPKQPVELVKSVIWNTGVTHKMEFLYNADSTLKEYKTGSSNIALKYIGAFVYNNKKPVKMTYDGGLTKYTYVDNKVSQKSYLNSDGVETARYNYTYNTRGALSGLKVQLAIFGVLSLTEDITYSYNLIGNLTETHNLWYNEYGTKYATVIRKYQSWSDELHINPVSLLHSLYQHQAREIFDDVVLSTLNKLPVKITETGDPERGETSYEYHISHTGNRIDKLNCTIKVGAFEPYVTNEATFHYTN